MLLPFSLCSLSISAAPAQEPSPGVVATTSWTAAFALAAGATSVHVLAPYELQHPPEYELKPSDIVVLSNAELVIFGGYERMVEKIRGALGEDAPNLLQIPTDYSLATIEGSIAKIANVLGTEDKIAESLSKYREFYADWRDELSNLGFAGARVITHAFLKPMAEELGVKVVGVFGPAPLEARKIAELSQQSAEIILDNWHNKTGAPLLEVMKETPSVELINFPGDDGTRTLLDVLETNRRRVREAIDRATGR